MLANMTDFNPHHFLYSRTPASWHPYLSLARVDRPTGIWLLLLPCLWGLGLADTSTAGLPLGMAVIFTVGAVLLRSAGCIINDLWDRKLDISVERTRDRPLASGRLTTRQAMLFLAGLLFAGLILLLMLNRLAIILGFASLALVVTYPLMKRVTWWPQLFLGFTFNWGVLMSWAAVTGQVSTAAVLLYAGGIFWTLAYDTVYAHQDREDDARIGIKSTALRLGQRSKSFVKGFLALAIILIVLAKYTASPSILTPLLLLPIVGHAIWQMKSWDPESADSSLETFRRNTLFGALVLLMLML